MLSKTISPTPQEPAAARSASLNSALALSPSTATTPILVPRGSMPARWNLPPLAVSVEAVIPETSLTMDHLSIPARIAKRSLASSPASEPSFTTPAAPSPLQATILIAAPPRLTLARSKSHPQAASAVATTRKISSTTALSSTQAVVVRRSRVSSRAAERSHRTIAAAHSLLQAATHTAATRQLVRVFYGFSTPMRLEAVAVAQQSKIWPSYSSKVA